MPFENAAAEPSNALLSRVLAGVETGFYIDWSAEDGHEPSLIDELYWRGWSGLSIRPAQQATDEVPLARPRDHVLTLPEGADLAGLLRLRHVAQPHLVRVNGLSPDATAAMLGLAPWLVLTPVDEASICASLSAAGYASLVAHDEWQLLAAPQHRDRILGATPDPLADLRAALSAAQASERASLKRMRDALRTAGRARADVGLLTDETKWLRGLLDESNQRADAMAGEIAWLRGILDAAQHEAEARQQQLEASARNAAHRAAQAEAALARTLGNRLRRRLGRVRQPQIPPQAPAEAPLSPAPLSIAETPQPAPLPAPEPPPPPAPARAVHPIQTVHQFHAGSAPGDAITNSMLLIRALLRSYGLRSDIYVHHRPDSLKPDGILLLEEMPRHADYVLLLHHSMGFTGLADLLALPAPKILVYHNITPPHFLGAIPRIARSAELGRQQLDLLRGAATAALADSAYNAAELAALGFDSVRTCPLLFDVAQIRARGAAPRLPSDVFTVLFVGRVTPSKSQDALIEAFAAFTARFPRPCRLALVGALDADEHEYLDRIDALITAHGLQDQVLLTGLVSDEELWTWFRRADLYVSLSRHEGFGVPLVEAMAHGIPVLAWPEGAVAETLGAGGTLLPSREPGDVAAAMLAAAQRSNPAPQAELARFELPRHVPVLLAALTDAGVSLPPGAPARQELAGAMHVAIAGHIAGSYSLAAVNRMAAAALDRHLPGRVRVIPIEGAPTQDLDGVPPDERPLIQNLSRQPAPVPGPEIILSQHYPVHVPDAPAELKAALFFWEESLIPADTVAVLSAGFDAVFAPSRFAARALIDSGVSRPVITLGLAPSLPGPRVQPVDKDRPFTFLHVSSGFPRKGVDALLLAWREAFPPDAPVRLVIKTFPNIHNQAAQQLALLRAGGDIAPVELIDDDLPGDALHRLSAQADAAVLPTRGEGYGLPAAEAMAAGIPVITTGYGGHMDFCSPATARLVRWSLQPSRSHLATPHSLWAEPDIADLAAAMREAAGRDGLSAQRHAAQAAIRAATDPAAWSARLTNAAATLLLRPPAPAPRIAWFSTWDVGCGIAEYSRTLLDEMDRDYVTILADERTTPAPGVEPCWRFGDPANADRLAARIGQLDADIVMIQHQPALLPWPALAELTHRLTAAGRAVLVTLHNTRHLAEQPAGDRAPVLAALAAAARVLVHSLADIDTLLSLGLPLPPVLLPHAAAAMCPASPRALDASAPVIGSTGFFLPGKGLGTLIQAVATLRATWPGIRLRLVNAEYDHPESAAELAACRALAEREGLDVEWMTDFQPLPDVHRHLQACDLLVLPYEASKESSSAALRTALRTGVPVAVTPLTIFDEAENAVARLGGTDAAAVASGIARLLADEPARARLQAAAQSWLAARAPGAVARRLHGMMAGLAEQRRLGQPLDGSLWTPPAP